MPVKNWAMFLGDVSAGENETLSVFLEKFNADIATPGNSLCKFSNKYTHELQCTWGK